MNSKKRLIVPVLLCALLLGSLGYGGWVWYDGNIDRSQWWEENGQLYYRDFHGDLLSGWQQIGDSHYRFREDGSTLLLWQELEDGRYYFGSDGAMTTGWRDIDGNRYYFGTDGVMRSGWLELDGQTYYLADGVLVSGWQEIEGTRYYFTESGPMANGFASIAGERYYFHDDGSMAVGEAELLGNRYFFNEYGVMQVGWLEWESSRRYYLPEGQMALGWQAIENDLYFFQDDGVPVTGWYEEGEYRYYFQEDGTASVGPTEIDGATHYFTPKGKEVVLVNANHAVPSWYKPELKTWVDHHQVDARCYDALKDMLDDCVDAGIEYEFNSGYRTVKTQQEILDYRTRLFMETYELPYAEAKARALRIVAVPGTSEHHLGLAVDLLGDEAQAWLQANCWDYGFILRYLEGKESWTGITDEPWHFRYVGKEIALDMKDTGLTLEEYLGADPVKPWLEQ